MFLLKRLVLAILFFFQATNSFAEVVTYVQDETFRHGPYTSGSNEEEDDDKQSRQIQGIHFNDDGTKLFTTYAQKPKLDSEDDSFQYVHEYNLSTPYDVSTRTYAGNNERCELGTDGNGHSDNAAHDLEFSNDGMKLFTSNKNPDILFRFDLTSPYDVSTCSYVYETVSVDEDHFLDGSNAGTKGNNTRLQGFEISDDGKKLFLLFHDSGTTDVSRLHEYNLSTPFDLRTLSLVKSAGINLPTAHVMNPNTMRFNNIGNRIFIVSHNSSVLNVTQVSLNSPYDTSQYTIDGSIKLTDIAGAEGLGQPRGISFNKSGLKMYVGHDTTDAIFEFDLVCPFNIIEGKCPPITENKDRTGIAEAQIDLAKRTMEYATDSALNRLRWIRRNKEKQNLTNHNINFDFSNPIMSQLAQKISTSNTEDKQEEKNQDVFYWSEGSISLGKIGDSSISSSKEISTDALTFGFDKFIDEKSLSGFAFRLGKNDTDVGSLGSNLDTDTYNLTFYNTSSKDDDTKFIDTILGVGKLNYDILTVLDNKNLTAEREGYQLYGTIRVKDEIKKDNLMLVPSVQLDLGRSFLGSYIESSGAGAISVDNQDVRTNKLRAALSLVEDLSKDDYVFKKHGKFEYSADLARSSNFKYFYVSDPNSRFSEKLSSGALHNLSGELGLDMVLKNNFSIFLIYEREQAIGYGHTDQIHIALGYLPENKMNYALKVDAKDDLRSKVLFSKKIGDYKLSFDHSHDFLGEGDNYLSSINLSKDF